MRGHPCPDPDAQRGNTFPKADLHNSIHNGHRGSVTKIILSGRLQALYVRLKTHTAAGFYEDKGNKLSAVFLKSFGKASFRQKHILLSQAISITQCLSNHYLSDVPIVDHRKLRSSLESTFEKLNVLNLTLFQHVLNMR